MWFYFQNPENFDYSQFEDIFLQGFVTGSEEKAIFKKVIFKDKVFFQFKQSAPSLHFESGHLQNISIFISTTSFEGNLLQEYRIFLPEYAEFTFSDFEDFFLKDFIPDSFVRNQMKEVFIII